MTIVEILAACDLYYLYQYGKKLSLNSRIQIINALKPNTLPTSSPDDHVRRKEKTHIMTRNY